MVALAHYLKATGRFREDKQETKNRDEGAQMKKHAM